jgi:hypothetical protein
MQGAARVDRGLRLDAASRGAQDGEGIVALGRSRGTNNQQRQEHWQCKSMTMVGAVDDWEHDVIPGRRGRGPPHAT